MIKPGVTDALIELTDLLATCADIVGIDLPDGAGQDSISMLPVLQGGQPTARKRDFAVHHSLWGDFAIRQGAWKMMPRRGSGGFSKPREVEPQPGEPIGQLYHLGDDPSETKNLWNERPEIVSMLTERLQQIMGN